MDTYPDLPVFRDLVFMFKLMMAPTSAALPDLKRWKPADAALSWSFKAGKNGHEGLLSVRGEGAWGGGRGHGCPLSWLFKAGKSRHEGLLSGRGEGAGGGGGGTEARGPGRSRP